MHIIKAVITCSLRLLRVLQPGLICILARWLWLKSNSESCVLFSFSNKYIIQIIACLLKHISLICVTEKWLNVWGNKKYPFVVYVSKLSNNFLILDLNCRQWFISKQNFHYLTCLLLQIVQGLKKTKWKDSSGNMHIGKK